MSQSLLYHAFGVRKGYRYQKTEYVEGRVEFYLEVDEKLLKCPECGRGAVWRRGGRQRRIRGLPIGLREVILVAEVPRCQCKQCGNTFEVSPPLPDPMPTIPTPWPDSSAS
jgi:transposase